MDLWIIIAIVVAVVALLAVIASGYVKAPPDKAFIISGMKKEPKILIGRAGIKFPFLERKDTLALKQISIDIKTNGYVPTLDFIGVDIDAVAKVRVKTDAEGIKLAMKNFLNMTENQIIAAIMSSGYVPDDEELEAAGMSREQAAALRQAWIARYPGAAYMSGALSAENYFKLTGRPAPGT